MSLKAQARLDVQTFTKDLSGFGVAVSVTNPSGQTREMRGLTGDVAVEMLDADNGQVFTMRRAYVSISIDQFDGFGTPRANADNTVPPWTFTFPDSEGTSRAYSVLECKPDRAVGLYTMTLEAFGLAAEPDPEPDP